MEERGQSRKRSKGSDRSLEKEPRRTGDKGRALLEPLGRSPTRHAAWLVVANQNALELFHPDHDSPNRTVQKTAVETFELARPGLPPIPARTSQQRTGIPFCVFREAVTIFRHRVDPASFHATWRPRCPHLSIGNCRRPRLSHHSLSDALIGN